MFRRSTNPALLPFTSFTNFYSLSFCALCLPVFSAASSRVKFPHSKLSRRQRGKASIGLLCSRISYAFLDIQPLSRGHALVIPKEHTVKFHELSDESLADILPVAKKIALALGIKDYNLLQNNGNRFPADQSLTLGRIAHQVVDHVHFHVNFSFK